jgi:hypothetical protein
MAGLPRGGRGVVRRTRSFGARRRGFLAAIVPRGLPWIVALFALTACGPKEPAPAPYVPGLGEIMTLNQMRHAKLWLAGDAGNWKLASYELDELEEGFHDVVEFHPTHKDSPVPITAVVPEITGIPLKKLHAAIAAKSRDDFAAAFDLLTHACNACHQATNFGFNVVKRPTANAFPNQDFAPPAADGK